ncbi:MAG: hypothetical protein ACJAW8_000609 [Oleispira sp.]|jgi:hypothetical protein
MDFFEKYQKQEMERIKAGSVDGKHFTRYIEEVKQLKKEKNHTEAISLLTKLVDATEKEFLVCGSDIAPWYYEQLAIIYRKEKLINEEIEILERYEQKTKVLRDKPSKLESRLVKAKEIYAKKV